MNTIAKRYSDIPKLVVHVIMNTTSKSGNPVTHFIALRQVGWHNKTVNLNVHHGYVIVVTTKPGTHNLIKSQYQYV